MVCANCNSQNKESLERRFKALVTRSPGVAQPDEGEGDKIVKSYLEVRTLPSGHCAMYSASVLCASVLPDTQGQQPL